MEAKGVWHVKNHLQIKIQLRYCQEMSAKTKHQQSAYLKLLPLYGAWVSFRSGFLIHHIYFWNEKLEER